MKKLKVHYRYSRMKVRAVIGDHKPRILLSAIILALFGLWTTPVSITFGEHSTTPTFVFTNLEYQCLDTVYAGVRLVPVNFHQKSVQSVQVAKPTTNGANAPKSVKGTFLFRTNLQGDAKTQAQRDYARKWAQYAVDNACAHATHIPPSIKIAQALLESGAGGSKLAKKSNNHFGIKCFSKQCGKGHCTNQTDDSHKDFFINYSDPRASFDAHYKFFTRSEFAKKNYARLQKLGMKDYKGWAVGLRKCGYATDPKYAEKLINIINTHKLWELDNLVKCK